MEQSNFQPGQRVIVIKQEDPSPPIGSTGIVIYISPISLKVGVRFDSPFHGGHTLQGRCEDGRGWYAYQSHISPVLTFIDEEL